MAMACCCSSGWHTRGISPTPAPPSQFLIKTTSRIHRFPFSAQATPPASHLQNGLRSSHLRPLRPPERRLRLRQHQPAPAPRAAPRRVALRAACSSSSRRRPRCRSFAAAHADLLGRCARAGAVGLGAVRLALGGDRLRAGRPLLLLLLVSQRETGGKQR